MEQVIKTPIPNADNSIPNPFQFSTSGSLSIEIGKDCLSMTLAASGYKDHFAHVAATLKAHPESAKEIILASILAHPNITESPEIFKFVKSIGEIV